MTAIHYPDLVAWSPSRNFRCEATSPYNLPEWHPGRVVSPTELVWPGAFQSDFEFTLYDGQVDAVRWTVEQAQVPGASPHALHVSDGGWCVVRTHGPFSAGLVTISPEGRVVQAIDLLAEVFVGPRAGYVHGTSAGPFWSGASRSAFVTLDRREWFCATTWWGQRILLDLERGRRVDDAPHAALLSRLEASWALETLRSHTTEAATWQGAWHELGVEWSAVEAIKSAVAIVQRSRPAGAEDALRPFEACGLLTGSTTCGRALERPGDLDAPRTSWWITCYEVRTLAALGLRRLGVRPRGYAAFAIRSRREDVEVALDVPDRIADRSDRARQVRPGQSGLDVVRLVGAPDHVAGSWDYDLLEHEGTLRIRWSYGAVVSAEFVPPGWLGEARDHWLFA